MNRGAWLGLLVVVACVDHGAGPAKKIDPSVIAANLLTQVPGDITRIDVELDGQVRYLGNTVDKPVVAPGQTVQITHYWQVIKRPAKPWRVFAFVRGSANTADFLNLEATDMQIGHPPATWNPGEIIRDVQDITLRPDWKSKTATVFVGLIAIGAHDTGDRMRATGPNTLDRAVIARKFEVDLSRAPAPPGTVYIPRAPGPIVIDGVANDLGWTGAVVSPDFATAEGSPEPAGKATGRLVWNDDYLYVFISVIDPEVLSEYKNHDDPLWKADAVELFIDADGNKSGYVELQVNPNNATFDSWFSGGRAPKGDETWDSAMVTAVKRKGTVEKSEGWDVEIGIPLAAVKGRNDAMAVRLPPRVGDRWKLNVVRVDKKSGSQVAAASWNRITYADWHGLDRLMTAVFADSTGSIIPKPDDGSGTGSAGSAAGSGVGPGRGSAVGSGSGSGSGTGPGSGSGSGSGIGPGNGIGIRPGTGSAIGPGPGTGTGIGMGTGSGIRPGTGSGSGPGTGSGSGTGAATGSGTGSGIRPGTGSGSGTGSATRPGSGSGAGSGSGIRPAAAATNVGSGSATVELRPRQVAPVGSGSAR